MILIWGFRARAKAVSTGEFFCTRCGADRSYVLQHIRRWFTFFFIPLFPVGKTLGEQVKCSTCGTCFRPEVLSTPTSASFSENLRGRGAVRGGVDARRRRPVATKPPARRRSMPPAGPAPRPTTTRGSPTISARSTPRSSPSTSRRWPQGLNLQGKETFIEQVARIGLADGPLSPSETRVLESLSATLGLSAAHLRGIVVSTTSPQLPSAGDGPPDEFRQN